MGYLLFCGQLIISHDVFYPISVQVGTPICFTRENELIDVGRVASIKNNDKPVDVAKKGQEVSIKERDDLTFVVYSSMLLLG